jgi:hypothetical protein
LSPDFARHTLDKVIGCDTLDPAIGSATLDPFLGRATMALAGGSCAFSHCLATGTDILGGRAFDDEVWLLLTVCDM